MMWLTMVGMGIRRQEEYRTADLLSGVDFPFPKPSPRPLKPLPETRSGSEPYTAGRKAVGWQREGVNCDLGKSGGYWHRGALP